MASAGAVGIALFMLLCCAGPLIFAGLGAAAAAAILSVLHARPILIGTIAVVAMLLAVVALARVRRDCRPSASRSTVPWAPKR